MGTGSKKTSCMTAMLASSCLGIVLTVVRDLRVLAPLDSLVERHSAHVSQGSLDLVVSITSGYVSANLNNFSSPRCRRWKCSCCNVTRNVGRDIVTLLVSVVSA